MKKYNRDEDEKPKTFGGKPTFFRQPMMDFFKPKSIEVWSLPINIKQSLIESNDRFNKNKKNLINAVAETEEYHQLTSKQL